MPANAGRTLSALCFLALAAAARADHPSHASGCGSGPIHAPSASTLEEGHYSLTLGMEYVDVDRFSDDRLLSLARRGNHHVHSTDYLLAPHAGFSYGVLDDLTLSLHLPYVFRDDIREAEEVHAEAAPAHHHEEGEEDEQAEEAEEVFRVLSLGDSAGIGDLLLRAQYRFVDFDDWDLEIAAIVGLKMPTGRTDDRLHGGTRFEAESQPGSGSWDPQAGLAVTKRFADVAVDLSGIYTIANEGTQGAELGDHVEFNLAASYRFGFGEPDHHGKRFWSVDLIAELNGEWSDKDKKRGNRDSNSGGTALFASPGVRFNVSEHWSVFASAGVPFVQELNGHHPELDVRLEFGVSLHF
ncbi:MAG: transporter [Planctomycetes bacterium]|nr:transporter [Planctomycetota bacterium]